MLEGQTRSIELKDVVYDVRLSFELEEFEANIGASAITESRILAELFSVNRAILFGESLLDFNKGGLLNNISSAENAAVHIDIVQQLESTYDTVIAAAGLVANLNGYFSGVAGRGKTALEIAKDFYLFAADMTFDHAEGAAFDFLFDAILAAARDLSSGAYETYLSIRKGNSVISSADAIRMAQDAASATSMSTELSSLVSSYDLENEGWLVLVKDLGLSVGSALFEAWALGRTANNVAALDPQWEIAIRSADTLSTGLGLVDFSLGSVETIAQMEVLIQSAKDRFDDQSLSFLSESQIDAFRNGFAALHLTPADPSDDFNDPDVPDDHSDTADTATVVSAGPIFDFTSLSGVIESRIDVDFFKADLRGGKEYSFILWADTTQNSLLDPELTVRAPNGATWRNDNLTNSTTMSVLSFVAPVTGTYVFEAAGVGGSTGTYWLNITPIDIDPTADSLTPTNGDTDNSNTSYWDWQGTGGDDYPSELTLEQGGARDVNDNNRYRGHDGDDRLRGFDGNDIVWGDDGEDRLYGGDGDDTLRGGRRDDIIDGDDGDDLIYGESGDDFIDGDTTSTKGFGHDTIYAGDGNDDVDGGRGNDYIKGEDDNDDLGGDDGDDEIYGDRGDDELKGEDGDDLLFGGPGNDELDGGEGRDRLAGEDGDDDLDGDEGDDALYGGDDDDLLKGGSGDDLLHGERGTDTADFSDGRLGVAVNLFDEIAVSGDLGTDLLYDIENIIGSDRDDVIDADHGKNEISGGKGDDIIRGHNGNDLIHGDRDDDVVWGDQGEDVVYGDAGDDEVRGGLDNDRLFGGSGKDHLRGEQGNDVIDGGTGDDTVFFWGEHDDFSIKEGNSGEVIVTDLRSNGLEGRDVLTNVEYIEFFDGKSLISDLLAVAPVAVNDAVALEGNRPTFLDLLSNDTTNATGAHYSSVETVSGGGSAHIIGGRVVFDPGSDFDGLAPGETGKVEISYSFMTSGFQTATATANLSITAPTIANTPPVARDDAFTTDANAAIAGGNVLADNGSGVDSDDDGDSLTVTAVNGQAGDVGQPIAVTSTGGRTGQVTIAADGDFNFDPLGDFEDLTQGQSDTLTVPYIVSDGNGGTNSARVSIMVNGLAEADSVGGAGDDQLVGDSGANRLLGMDGRDLIYGFAGHDELHGGNGNDILVGGDGNDRAYGGEGADYAYGGNGVDVLSGGEGTDVLLGQAGSDYLFGGAGFDYLYGGDETDVLVGNGDTDVLYGERGVDWLYGGAGVDWLLGGDDADMMFGEADPDLLFGGNGNDWLDGGAGNDWFWGGSGADRFVSTGTWGHDVIFDYQDGIDRIDFSYAGTVARMGNLSIVDSGGYAVISDGVNALYLAGIGAYQLSAADFLF